MSREYDDWCKNHRDFQHENVRWRLAHDSSFPLSHAHAGAQPLYVPFLTGKITPAHRHSRPLRSREATTIHFSIHLTSSRTGSLPFIYFLCVCPKSLRRFIYSNLSSSSCLNSQAWRSFLVQSPDIGRLISSVVLLFNHGRGKVSHGDNPVGVFAAGESRRPE